MTGSGLRDPTLGFISLYFMVEGFGMGSKGFVGSVGLVVLGCMSSFRV